VLGFDFLNDKVGTDMAEKEPKFTSRHSCLEPHERVNVIGSPNFRYFVGCHAVEVASVKGPLPILSSNLCWHSPTYPILFVSPHLPFNTIVEFVHKILHV
jgi:hypothetical protein